MSDELKEYGYNISHNSVGLFLHDMGYSLQANKKTLEESNHPDRDAQFKNINDSAKSFHSNNNPVISVDTKKKELIGNYKNNGREYVPKGKPIEVNCHDFKNKNLGKAIPYGVYDIGKNKGWVSVGISSDTAEFAVNTIRSWWNSNGLEQYPETESIMITADCGGSNSYRSRLWKVELQKLSNELNLTIKVMHFPPGTSKWNKIEHKLFSYISKNWRGRPLVDKETVVNLIAATTTKKGLTVASILDKNIYKKGIKVSDDQLEKINLSGDDFHPEWNYYIRCVIHRDSFNNKC